MSFRLDRNLSEERCWTSQHNRLVRLYDEETLCNIHYGNARPTFYVGITDDLIRRVYEQKNNLNPRCFTARYHLHRLVYYEFCENSFSAIIREKQIRNVSRKKKIELIMKSNPTLMDLYEDIAGRIPDKPE